METAVQLGAAGVGILLLKEAVQLIRAARSGQPNGLNGILLKILENTTKTNTLLEEMNRKLDRQ